ncbi:MAG TPA: hypothetical protein VM033_01700 [Gemmatimonadaceae bacterium]|nr:hypothetical protein [Gemmatimonadaceae bacterium]
MMELAGREHDFSRYDSLAAQLARRRGVPPLFAARALTAVGSGDTERRATVLAEVRGADATDPVPAWVVATFTEDLDAAREIAAGSLRRAPTPRETAQLQLALAGVELAAGRWQAGRAALAAAAAASDRASAPALRRVAQQVQAFCASLPILSIPPSDVVTVRAAVDAWPSTVDSSAFAQDLPGALQPHMRLYLLGLFDARNGAYEDALRRAATIEGLAAVRGTEPVARTLVRGVRAAVALQRGDPTAALAELGPTNEVIPPIYAAEFRPAEVHARWLRAEALFALRRDDEALHWYALVLEAPVANGAMLELVLAAPTHLRRAQIDERRGNNVKAEEQYRRVQAMWRGADPPALALVQRRGARATRLAPDQPVVSPRR